MGSGSLTVVSSGAQIEDQTLAGVLLLRMANSCILEKETSLKTCYDGVPPQIRPIQRTNSAVGKPSAVSGARHRRKTLHIVGEHNIAAFWEQEIAPRILVILETRRVDWSSIDVVRFGYADEQPGTSQLVVWIGVRKAGSLPCDFAFYTTHACKNVLLAYDINDVEVELRESDVVQLSGSSVLKSVPSDDPTADVRGPFTSTLGIPVCSRRTPKEEGTGSFFLADGADPKRLLLVTARHVLFPEGADHEDEDPQDANTLRHDVLMLSNKSFARSVLDIDNKIREQDRIIGSEKVLFTSLKGRQPTHPIDARMGAEKAIQKAERDQKRLQEFSKEIWSHWSAEHKRVLGHVVFSPPISVGEAPLQFTQDIAVIDVDPLKVNPSTFEGNVIDLGFKYTPSGLTKMMHPNPKNPPNLNFKFPENRLLPLRGTVGLDELHKPTTYDEHGNRCLLVLKNGKSTGLTVGRANSLMSITRQLSPCGTKYRPSSPMTTTLGRLLRREIQVRQSSMGRVGLLVSSIAQMEPARGMVWVTA